jgi:hypothetical protein
MNPYCTRPRRLRLRQLLCLRPSSHVWCKPDTQQSASRRWQTHLLGRFVWLLRVCVTLTTSARASGGCSCALL